MARIPTHLLTASVAVAALFGVAAVDPKEWRGNSLEGLHEDAETKQVRIQRSTCGSPGRTPCSTTWSTGIVR